MRLLKELDNRRHRRNKEETAVSGTLDVSYESKLITEPRADLDGLAGVPSSERNDANDYAAYWRARSGLLIPITESDYSLH